MGSEVPRIPDGVIYRVLDKLLMLNGEKLSYRTLDVEQIGSVYEGIMGFTVERSSQPSIGVKSGGAKKTVTVVIDVAELLATKPADRSKKLNDWASCKLASDGSTLLKQATTIPEIVDALSKKRSPQTPDILPQGALYLQPTAERRRSGSHYTPRALTQPIVAKTLEPIFQQLGDKPTPEQILDLKICDPAMGSGAFLVEACRQLADKLVEAWEREQPPHPLTPSPTSGEGGHELEPEALAPTPAPVPLPPWWGKGLGDGGAVLVPKQPLIYLPTGDKLRREKLPNPSPDRRFSDPKSVRV